MNLRSLATLLLRLFGITHCVKIVSSVFTTTAYLQQTLWDSQTSNIGNLVIVGTFCAIIAANVIACALIFRGKSLSKRLIQISK